MRFTHSANVARMGLYSNETILAWSGLFIVEDSYFTCSVVTVFQIHSNLQSVSKRAETLLAESHLQISTSIHSVPPSTPDQPLKEEH